MKISIGNNFRSGEMFLKVLINGGNHRQFCRIKKELKEIMSDYKLEFSHIPS